MLIYQHFSCIFKLLAAVAAHAGLRPDIPEFAPLRRLIAHTAHTKIASITKLPSGAYRVQIRRKGRYASKTFLPREDAHHWARQCETLVDQGLPPNRSSVARLHTFGDLVDLHIADMCAVGKPPRWSNAATLATLKRDLGKEKIGYPLEAQRRTLLCGLGGSRCLVICGCRRIVACCSSTAVAVKAKRNSVRKLFCIDELLNRNIRLRL